MRRSNIHEESLPKRRFEVVGSCCVVPHDLSAAIDYVRVY